MSEGKLPHDAVLCIALFVFTIGLAAGLLLASSRAFNGEAKIKAEAVKRGYATYAPNVYSNEPEFQWKNERVEK